MNEILTALVGFIFVCIVIPRLVRNTTQFYLAIGGIVAVLICRALGMMFLAHFFGFMILLLELIVFVLLILATGGLSLSAFTGELVGALEVVRRGESEKEVIIPLTGQQPKPREPADEPRRVYRVDDPPRKDDSSLPLE